MLAMPPALVKVAGPVAETMEVGASSQPKIASQVPLAGHGDLSIHQHANRATCCHPVFSCGLLWYPLICTLEMCRPLDNLESIVDIQLC